MQISKLLPLTMFVLVLTTAAYAQDKRPDLKPAEDLVGKIRLPDLPVVSTGTIVQPIAPPPQQMPRGGSDIERMRKNPPPPPQK